MRAAVGTPELVGFWFDRPASAIPFAAEANGFQAFSGKCIYLGFALFNSASSGGQFRISDGLNDTTRLIDVMSVGATSAIRAPVFWPGILCESGIWALPAASTVVTGTIWYLPLDERLLAEHDRQVGVLHSGGHGQGNTGVSGHGASGHPAG